MACQIWADMSQLIPHLCWQYICRARAEFSHKHITFSHYERWSSLEKFSVSLLDMVLVTENHKYIKQISKNKSLILLLCPCS